MALPRIQIGDGMLEEALLSSVDVVQELNRHWWCTVVCRNTEDRRIPVEDLLGKPVEVTTTDEQGVERTHFSGSVHDVRLDYEAWGSYTATLTAVSDSFGMDVTAHKQYYTDGTLSSIAGTIASRHGLDIAIKATDGKALNYVQYGESDWSFLHRIVDDAAAWMRPSKSGVEVFDSFQPGSTVQWREEGDLLGFSLQGRRVNPSFSGSHYDHHAMQSNTFQKLTKPPQMYSAAERLTGSVQAASAQLPSGFEPQRARAMSLDQYSDQLLSESERGMGGAVTGTGRSLNQAMMAGNTVTIDGVLDAKGMYGLTRVAHFWTRQGYTNEFACTPWKNYRNPEPPAARTWSGVVSARVTGHNDPKKMGRVQVQFFWQEDGSTHWARATSPHAGPDRGFMFMPEVGDEVAVAFEDGDPERPVILGSLWNGSHQAPRKEFRGGDIEPNDVKRLVTKSGNRLHLSDKPGQETVLLATPNHTSLNMTEHSDETGRQLVHLHSDGDIVLSAGGRIHLQSQFFSREVGSPGKAEAAAAAKLKSQLSEGKTSVPIGLSKKINSKALAAWRRSHQKEIATALANQHALLVRRQADLTKWDDQTKADARKWFGSDTRTTRQVLLDRTNREIALNERMHLDNFRPASPSEPGQFAYVYPNDPDHQIYLDTQFEQADHLGTDSQAGTLSHEMSHYEVIGGTKDYVYSPPHCVQLARQNPGKALFNADSYEYFIENVK